MSFEKLIWWQFSFIVSINKTLFKSYIISPFELTLDDIVLNNCLLDATCFTSCRGQFHQSQGCVKDWLNGADITAQLNQCQEKMRQLPVLEDCEAGLYGRIAVKKPLLRNQNNVKRLQWAKAHKDWTTELWNKILWTDESKFRIFWLNKRVSVQQKSLWKSCNSPYHTQP